MNSIDFGGQSVKVKVKVTMDMYRYGNNFVNIIEIELLYASSSNFADMMKGCPLLIFEVRGQIMCVCVCHTLSL